MITYTLPSNNSWPADTVGLRKRKVAQAIRDFVIDHKFPDSGIITRDSGPGMYQTNSVQEVWQAPEKGDRINREAWAITDVSILCLPVPAVNWNRSFRLKGVIRMRSNVCSGDQESWISYSQAWSHSWWYSGPRLGWEKLALELWVKLNACSQNPDAETRLIFEPWIPGWNDC